MSKTLIVGATSQSAPFLITDLIKRGHEVVGTVRNFNKANSLAEKFNYNIPLLGCDIVEPSDIHYVLRAFKPDNICFIAGESSAERCRQNYETAFRSNVLSISRWLDMVLRFVPDCRFYNFSSVRIFEGCTDRIVRENSQPKTSEIYSNSKRIAYEYCLHYRYFGLKTYNLVLDQHTSPLQDTCFVIPKIMEFVRQNIDKLYTSTPIPSFQLRDWNAVCNFGLTSEFMSAIADIVDSQSLHDPSVIISNNCRARLTDFIRLLPPLFQQQDPFADSHTLPTKQPPQISNSFMRSLISTELTVDFSEVCRKIVYSYLGDKYVATAN